MVFEWQTEDGAISDVYNYRDERQAKEKFAELRDEIMGAVGHTQCEVIDDPAHYSVINRSKGIYGYIRLLDD